MYFSTDCGSRFNFDRFCLNVTGQNSTFPKQGKTLDVNISLDLARGVNGIGGKAANRKAVFVKENCPRRVKIDQMLHECNQYNDFWAELDAFFATNPWAGEGTTGAMQQLAFMVCYNVDDFRSYTEKHNLLNNFKLNKDERRRIQKDDGALLRFGFDWLEYILGGRKRIIKK